MVPLDMQLSYIHCLPSSHYPSTGKSSLHTSCITKIYLFVRLVHSLHPSLIISCWSRISTETYISMLVPISPDLPAVTPDSVSYYVYYPDLYIPRRIMHNMGLRGHGGKPRSLRMTNLVADVCGAVLANLDLLVL